MQSLNQSTSTPIHSNQNTPTETAKPYSIAALQHKLIALLMMSIALTWLAASINFSERWISWATQFEQIEINELPVLFFALAMGLSVILVGHHRELSRQARLRSTLESEVYREATRDRLTGLANHNLFTEHLIREIHGAKRSNKKIALFIVELPELVRFREVHGYQAVDEVLITISKRLKKALRKTDTLARFGDNEFAILQPNLPQPMSASVLGQRLLAVLQKPIVFDGKPLDVQVVIGATLSTDELTSPQELCRRAAIALRRHGKEDSNRFTFFEDEMDRCLKDQASIERDLKNALALDQFTLHYQPQYLADGATLIGAEALLRWHHPERGWVSPGQFVPIAEDLGLIGDIEQWAIVEACRTATQWPNSVRLSVNISPQHLLTPIFTARIARTLKETGLSPSRLELEVTESILVSDTDKALETVRALRQMNVRIALDDFGTGYSSLSYLRLIPFDKLKIDRSFVQDIENSPSDITIIEAVTTMGSSLGMDVMVEGVENHNQLMLLKSAGCNQLQGFLFSRPVTADKLSTMF